MNASHLNDIRAAILYLIFFQVQENLIEDDSQESIALKCSWEISTLVQMGYPDPTTIVYDNEGIPQINWQNPNTSTPEILALYEHMDWDPNYFSNHC